MAKTIKTKPTPPKANAPRGKAKPKPVAAPPAAPALLAPQPVTITAAKGRPMLTWVGKHPLTTVTAFPAQHVETYPVAQVAANAAAWPQWPKAYPQGGLLFHGDNKEVLAHLLANGFRGQVKLIYIDPPFDSGADYVRKVKLRGSAGPVKLDGETYTLGEQIQYTDIWANDNYLQFMFERLQLLRELLAEDGNILLHCDWRMVHRLRLILDEVFGQDHFVNEVVWTHTVLGGTHGRRLPKAHETILWYSKGPNYIFNKDAKSARVEFGDYIKKTLRQDEDGRWFYTRGRMSRQPSDDELARKAFTTTYVENPEAGTIASDIWDDMLAYRVYGDENSEYPTQKNEALIERFVELGCDPGDLVLDCFIGSGTTVAVAQKLGRRWIACDINKGAIQTTAKRLQGIMHEQVEALAPAAQPRLVEAAVAGETEAAAAPAQLAFGVWRVNDYDLQIQHNEAANLAAEHLGIERTRTDAFFDGTLHNSKRLVKISAFTHPLSPLDLEEVKRELDARPDEARPITIVCLGIELAARAWLEDWNQLRKGKEAANRIDVVELRSDPRYGGFLAHRPATARVKVRRQKDTLHIDVVDFISPSILERLAQQAGPLLAPQIDDWRAMVDSVMIDPAYNGQVFNVALADVPARKDELVGGVYDLPAPAGPTTVAVKITDMLGEEVLWTAAV